MIGSALKLFISFCSGKGKEGNGFFCVCVNGMVEVNLKK